MVSWVWIVVAVLIVLAAAAIAWTYLQRRRSAELRGRFGPEYEREVNRMGRGHAEAELQRRERRVERLQIRELSAADRDRFSSDWQAVQARFGDDPKAAVAEADVLVAEVMRARGYPVGNFEQRAADISVDHPRVVENYRAAHTIAVRDQRGEGSTEDLRQAMVHYRALFEDLLGTRVRVAGRSEVRE